jgi:Flp pilus assembly protein TadG
MVCLRRARLRRGLAGLSKDRRGAAAVEFALIAPILLLLMAGLVDGSRYIVQAMQVNAAAQAGADFAVRNGWNAAGITTAVTTATPLAVTASPAPTQGAGCAVGTAVQAAVGGSCPNGGGAPGNFVLVSAQKAFTPIMPWPGLPRQPTLSAQARVRIP